MPPLTRLDGRFRGAAAVGLEPELGRGRGRGRDKGRGRGRVRLRVKGEGEGPAQARRWLLAWLPTKQRAASASVMRRTWSGLGLGLDTG